jgi:hypothetical protein
MCISNLDALVMPDSEDASAFATGSSRSNAIVVAPGDESAEIDVEDLDVDKIMEVNSAIAVEKEIAADTMGTIFEATKNHFLGYIETCVLALVELLAHYYEGIRKSATDSLLQFVRTFYDLSSPAEWTPGMNIVCLSHIVARSLLTRLSRPSRLTRTSRTSSSTS